MSGKTAKGECKFAYPVHGSESMVRALLEHGDGRWSICASARGVAEQMKSKPLQSNDTFDMQRLIDTATRRFVGDRSITDDDPHYALRLAAGVLMFATALGIIDISGTTE
jgi:hypothetical protein